MTQTLNFYPENETNIHLRRKTCSVRLGKKYAKKFQVGEEIFLTSGVNPKLAFIVARVQITKIEVIQVKDITKEILESEGFSRISWTGFVKKLAKIYVRPISELDTVTIIWWKYL